MTSCLDQTWGVAYSRVAIRLNPLFDQTFWNIMTRIVFMGSPAEVIAPLRAVYEEGESVGAYLVGIVSQPARPAGRGGKLLDPPVALFGKEHSVPTLQPESAKDVTFLEQLKELKPDVIVTAAYGQILSEEFLKIPRVATINIHPSLLPAFRGATPVPAALLDGLDVTGVTILFTVKQLDAGNIILQKSFPVGPRENAGELTNRLFRESGPMLLDVLALLAKEPNFKGTPQNSEQATFCRKISKEMGQVNWSDSAKNIINRHRAFQPWPGSMTKLGDRLVAITDMDLGNTDETTTSPGLMSYEKVAGALMVCCGRGHILIRRLKPAGGKEMDAAAFWNGLRDRSNPRLG